MINKIIKVTVFTIMVFIGPVLICYPASEKLTLKMGLKKGESYVIKFHTAQTVVQKLNDQDQKVTQDLSMEYVWKVLEVSPEGLILAEFKYDSIIFKRYGSLDSVEYDSSKPSGSTNPMIAGYAGLIGKAFLIKLSPQGQVMDVQGGDMIVKSILDKMNIPEGHPKKAQMEEILKEHFSSKALKAKMENMLSVYPGKPVAVGDSWEKEMSSMEGFPFTAKTIYTLAERNSGIATIKIKSTIKSDPNTSVGPTGNVYYDISGTQEGMMKIDESKGWVMQSAIDQGASGQVRMGVDSGITDSTSWPITLNSTVTTESFPKN